MTRDKTWIIDLSVEQVIQAQGGDPEKIRERNPLLIRTAEKAIQLAKPNLDPRCVFEKYLVTGVSHQRVMLNGKTDLVGKGVADFLAQAHEVIAVVATTGSRLEELTKQLMEEDPALALAVDAYGSAAVEELVVCVCRKIEENYLAEGKYTSIPFSPGLEGWDLADGQKQVFSLVDAGKIGVTLTNESLMVPRKSSSFVIGLGKIPFQKTSTCEFCSMQKTCRYRDHK